MNNKGQVFTFFILLLPVMIMILALVVDLGLLMVDTYKTKTIVKEAISYGLKENDIEGMTIQLDSNNINYHMSNNGNIKIEVNGKYKTVFSKVFKKNEYQYSFTYLGYIDNGNVHIEEEG